MQDRPAPGRVRREHSLSSAAVWTPAMSNARGRTRYGSFPIPSKWLPIQLAPEHCDLELGEMSKIGIAPWSFPCRRKSEVWFNVWTNEPVLICPTHWRIWREPWCR
jgi:hypothetical protein